jgi:protein required for attachment to host cells
MVLRFSSPTRKPDMKLYGPGLVVVADGAHARAFEERVRGGPLVEITAQLGELGSKGAKHSSHTGRVHDRFGPASHTTGGDSPRVKAEEAFIRRLAVRIDDLMATGSYENLVLIAAPRALGDLRAALGPGGPGRTLESEAADRVKERPPALREALRRLRSKPDHAQA